MTAGTLLVTAAGTAFGAGMARAEATKPVARSVRVESCMLMAKNLLDAVLVVGKLIWPFVYGVLSFYI